MTPVFRTAGPPSDLVTLQQRCTPITGLGCMPNCLFYKKKLGKPSLWLPSPRCCVSRMERRPRLVNHGVLTRNWACGHGTYVTLQSPKLTRTVFPHKVTRTVFPRKVVHWFCRSVFFFFFLFWLGVMFLILGAVNFLTASSSYVISISHVL